jgi:hypothetical protein
LILIKSNSYYYRLTSYLHCIEIINGHIIFRIDQVSKIIFSVLTVHIEMPAQNKRFKILIQIKKYLLNNIYHTNDTNSTNTKVQSFEYKVKNEYCHINLYDI